MDERLTRDGESGPMETIVLFDDHRQRVYTTLRVAGSRDLTRKVVRLVRMSGVSFISRALKYLYHLSRRSRALVPDLSVLRLASLTM